MEMIMVLGVFWGVPLLIYLLCAIPALRELKGRGLDETSRAVWALAIVAIPIMGALAFWIMQPGEQR
ncbi:MAG: PLDc N-terminal domain-containing protein [Acidobacteria bacterium]|nr:PLDc N-terminal domain-containing protein [Acidobacteriota bacterium]